MRVGAPLLEGILMPAIDSRNLQFGRSISGDDLLAHLRTERGLCHGIISRYGPAEPQVARIDSGHQDGCKKRCADTQVAPRVPHRLSPCVHVVLGPRRRHGGRVSDAVKKGRVRGFDAVAWPVCNLATCGAYARELDALHGADDVGARAHGTRLVQVKFGGPRGSRASRGTPPAHVG